MSDQENQTPPNATPYNNQPQPPAQPQPGAPPPPGGYYMGTPPRGFQPGSQPPGGYPPPPPPGYAWPSQPPPRKRRWWIPVTIGGGCLTLLIIFFVVIGAALNLDMGETRGGHIALIRVTGVITGGRSGGGLFSGSSAGSEDLISQLEKARKKNSVKAIVIRINSPGGSAAASEEVYNEIKRVREDGKKVYVSMGDVAASGGYYIAAACDRIYADAGTMTGSIGVIMETADMSQLFKKIGWTPEVIKSGKFKDIGSSNRPMTPAERQLLQAMVNDIYEEFVNCVAAGRKMPVSEVKKIADGRILTGKQAVKAKLVDKIGGLRETILAAGRAAGIRGEPTVVEYKRRGMFGQLFGEDGDDAESRISDALARRALEELVRQSASSRELGGR